jgi:hypothetical protein
MRKEAGGSRPSRSEPKASEGPIRSAMDFEWEDEHRAFLAELRAFIKEWRTPALLAEYFATYGAGGPELSRFRAALEEKGWARMCWPVEQGGQGRNLLYQFLFVEEMEYWGMPYGNLTYTSIGPSIQHFGNEEQKRRWLPGIWSGEYSFAIGYSEPNAGTDLAALRTRGVRAADDHAHRVIEVRAPHLLFEADRQRFLRELIHECAGRVAGRRRRPKSIDSRPAKKYEF